jgi:membrane protein DedA with SNARE-associated domain
MQELIIEFINQYGYWGIGILMILENFLLFIPSEVILTFGGFMTTYSSLNVWLVVLSATGGSLSGAILLYGAGRLISHDYLIRILYEKPWLRLHLPLDDIKKAGYWFTEKGIIAVFVGRFIPIIRCLISIPAGMAKMHIGVFILLTTMGVAVWNTVLIWMGVVAGESWERIAKYMHTYSVIALLVLAILVIVTAAVTIYNNMSRRRRF